jgi:hypothetical protein
MWRPVVWYMSADVSEQNIASIFRVINYSHRTKEESNLRGYRRENVSVHELFLFNISFCVCLSLYQEEALFRAEKYKS